MSDSNIVNTPETVNNATVDLDKEIPNYANELQMSMQSSMDNVKQLAGEFFANKWNDAKTLMQYWSLGLDNKPNNQSLSSSQPQVGGRKSKRGKKSRRKKYTKKR
jgi:hypothetical protein